MTQIDSSLPATLRRRARDMEAEHYNPTHISCLLRAADELEVRRRMQTDEEGLAVALLADNRRLRNTLVEVFGQIRARKPAGWIDQVQDRIKGALGAVREWGKGRRIIAAEIANGETRHQVEEKIHAALDTYFTAAVAPVEPGEGCHGADGDSRPHDAELDAAVGRAPDAGQVDAD